MFVDFQNERPLPDPWRPKRSMGRLTKRQERLFGWIIGFNILMLLVAPLGGSTLIMAAVALITR